MRREDDAKVKCTMTGAREALVLINSTVGLSEAFNVLEWEDRQAHYLQLVWLNSSKNAIIKAPNTQAVQQNVTCDD